MARIRTVKPEIWQDEAFGSATVAARLLFIGLITQADDEGRLRAHPTLLSRQVFPYDGTLPSRVERLLSELADRGLIVRYVVRGEQFVALPAWKSHQKINRPTPSKIPGPEQALSETHGGLSEGSVSVHGGLMVGTEGRGATAKGKAAVHLRSISDGAA